MQKPFYKQNNLRLILESIGVKLDGSRKLSFPITKGIREKLGISTTRFRQLVNNDQEHPEITHAEVCVLANHFGCSPELLTMDLPDNSNFQIQMALCDEELTEPVS